MSHADAPPRLAFAGVAFAFLVTMLGTTLPTPLYPGYQTAFGFSQLIITVIFAAYAVGVIAALLVAGRWSDQLGRRPLLFAGLTAAALSDLVFLGAEGLSSLLAGRVLSGMSAGIFTGTAIRTGTGSGTGIRTAAAPAAAPAVPPAPEAPLAPGRARRRPAPRTPAPAGQWARGSVTVRWTSSSSTAGSGRR